MDNKNDIINELRKLAISDERPATKRLRQIFGQIEEALSAGASRKQVYDTLVENGYNLTFDSFLVTLSRLRKERRAGVKPTTAVAQAPPLTLPGTNPLKGLASRPKAGEFSAFPAAKFELDQNSSKKG